MMDDVCLQETESLDLTTIRDVRTGKFGKFPRVSVTSLCLTVVIANQTRQEMVSSKTGAAIY